MKKEHSYNVLKVLQIIRALLLIIMSIMVISSAIIGHCASDQDYFPMFQNHNGNFTDADITYIENYYNTTDNYIFAYFSGYAGGYGTRMKNFYIISIPKTHNEMVYGEKFNNLYQFSIYSVGNLAGNQFDFLQILDQGWYYHYSASISNFQNLQSSNYNNSVDYISNFQLMTNNTSTAQIVLFYDDGITIPDDDTAREDMEKPQIKDYIPDWTNPPSFDNSSVENALKSVYNGVVWLGSNIKDTIKGTGEYIADTMRWSIQKVLNTIRDVFSAVQDKINEVKTTILTVVDKVQATIDYISQPYDSTKVNVAFNNMTIKADYNNLTTLVNDAFSVFNSTSEPNTFQIPIHLERIPILHVQNVQYIDLGWLYDCRGIIRAFMWCVTTFGLLYTIIDSLPNYLSGNDE